MYDKTPPAASCVACEVGLLIGAACAAVAAHAARAAAALLAREAGV